MFFRAAGAVSSCSTAIHASGLNHFSPNHPSSEEEPSKHMENITARQEEVGKENSGNSGKRRKRRGEVVGVEEREGD